MASVIAIAFLIILVLFPAVSELIRFCSGWAVSTSHEEHGAGFSAVRHSAIIIYALSFIWANFYTYLLVQPRAPAGSGRAGDWRGAGGRIVPDCLLLEKNTEIISSGTGSWGLAAATCM